MPSPPISGHDWQVVDEGWGRRAVDFATLAEPSNCREYVAMHHRLGVGSGDRLLDIACGSGLAVELAGIRGARCAGIDASPRLLAVARDRNPDADLRLGDMHALPWEDDCFDVVTSFRGIWGTTPEALAEVLRVLAPGGRVGLTVWGHIKVSPGAWAFEPFKLATEAKVENQAAMVALGGRESARAHLPTPASSASSASRSRSSSSSPTPPRSPVPWPPLGPPSRPCSRWARTPSSSTPPRWPRSACATGSRCVLRSPSPASSPASRRRQPSTGNVATSGAGFLATPEPDDDAKRLFDVDVDEVGYVMNVTRMWSHEATLFEELFDLLGHATRAGTLTFRQRGILVSACASALGDSYCSLAWGTKLSGVAGADVAAAVLRGDDSQLDASERALAGWARQVAQEPNGTDAGDVQALRDAGFDDRQILAITCYVAMRIAFSTVNDALGSRPDHQLVERAPAAVRAAVTFGRPVADPPE